MNALRKNRIAEANKLYGYRKYNNIIELYSNEEEYERDEKILLIKTMIHISDYQKASEYINKLFLNNANDSEAYFYRGIVNVYNKELKDALEDFNKALYHGFDSVGVWINIANVYAIQDDIEQAVKYLNLAISQSDNMVARRKKLDLCLEYSLYEEAINTIDSMLMINASIEALYYQKIWCLLKLIKVALAKEIYENTKNIFPNSSLLKIAEVDILVIEEKYDDAIEIIDSMIADSPNERLTILKARVLLAQQQLDKAAELLRSLMSSESKSVISEAGYYLMIAAMVLQDVKSGYECTEKMINNDYKNEYYYAAVYYNAVFASNLEPNKKNEIYTSAINELEKEVKNPRISEINDMYIAACYKDIGEYGKATKKLDELSDNVQLLGQIYFLRSQIATLSGNHELGEQLMSIAKDKELMINMMVQNI